MYEYNTRQWGNESEPKWAHRVADARLGGLPGAFFGAHLELEELDGDRLALGLRVEELTELRARCPLAVPLPALAHAERVLLELHVASCVGERRTPHQRVQARVAPIAGQPLRLVLVLHTRCLVWCDQFRTIIGWIN